MLKKPAPAAAAPVPARARRPRRATIKTIDLALQGGGSHGAFTWGVLDRLLEEEWLEIAAISGTSAGAMNAVALAAGLMDGGRTGAQRVLRAFWRRVAELSPFHHWQVGPLAAVSAPIGAWWNPWMEPLARVAAQWSGQFSPYQLNPLNLHPLRNVLAATVDFDRVRHCTKSQLFIAATQVRTGALRVFAQRDLNADVVLASACLPLLFQAVEIDGEAYWDGGYAGNPSLMPLITDGPADDLLLVQINPIERAELPTRADDILDRINEVTFNSSLLKELRLIALLQQLVAGQRRSGHADGERLFQRIRALRVHLLDGGEALGPLGASSKTNTQWTFLTRLHALGRASAEHWLAEHGNTIGLRSSFDPATVLRM
ncbi:patatin-like phospholipase family protein [Comamonadaceae bacterium G21597-S1]|nr:patatin-like phospholipase family protein [Comamonadaceae bacterium G21597-S1]